MKNTIKEDDIVMCTVRAIEGATVFVDIEGNGRGSISMSEVAAGRIRNLREHVVLNKKIACKVLKVYPDHLELSLRRVTGKEREQIQERYKKERTLFQLLKPIFPNPQEILEAIKGKYDIDEFFDSVRSNTSVLENFMDKSQALKLAPLMEEKEGREKEVKKLFILKTSSESGLSDIKEILSIPEIEIHYLGSSQFSITSKALDFKEANTKVSSALEQIEKRAKEKKAHFEVKEK